MTMRVLFVPVFLLMTVCVTGQDYSLSVSSGSIPDGGSGSLAITMDNNGADVAGWSFGVCNDTGFLTCTGAADGSTTAVVKNGGPPDFNQIGVFDEGFTVGVVICFTGCAVLAPGSGYEINVADYTCNQEGSTTVAFCDTLGSPPVATVVVVDGASIVPAQNSGDVECIGVPDPEYTYSAGSTSAGYNPADGNASASRFGTFNVAAGFVVASVRQHTHKPHSGGSNAWGVHKSRCDTLVALTTTRTGAIHW